jgi:hypothetical protein
MAEITVSDLTTGEISGNGVFDQLMRSTETHLVKEYEKSRIKGSEYATVYLGALQAVMDRSLQFLLAEQRTDLEAQLLTKQVATETLNQNLITEQTGNATKQGKQIEAQTALINEQTANAIIEGTVLTAQKCKLEAEFDLIVQQKLKTVAETALLAQKKVTESAQVTGDGVADNSVIGKQKLLYTAQTAGYLRDSELKVGKLMSDSWNVRKTMDSSGTVNTFETGLTDAHIGSAINAMLTGIGATIPIQ